MTNLEVYCDGGSRGNPGPAAVGIVIKKDNQINRESGKQIEISKYIGKATNNQAEYRAVIEALQYINETYGDNDIEVNFLLDSKLVVEQLNQRYKLKNEGLKPLFFEIHNLIKKLSKKISFTHIPREKNVEADKLVNVAIDKVQKTEKS